MITLYGTRIHKGIAIAEAAVIGPDGDLSGLSSDLLQRGIQALQRRMPDSEKPQVVIVSESVDDGLAIRLPGIKVAAVAAQSPREEDGCSVPCVAGLDDLMQSVNEGDIVIVDGGSGVVYIDPAVDTLIHYQSLESSQTAKRLFLESVHLPAVTQDGRTISVFAVAVNADEARAALDEGADGILFTENASLCINVAEWDELLRDSGSKKIILTADPGDAALRALLAGSLPQQVTIAPAIPDQDVLHHLALRIDKISNEIAMDKLDAVEAAVGLLLRPFLDCAAPDGLYGIARILLDATACEIATRQTDLAECISEALRAAAPVAGSIPVTVILADSIDAVQYLPSGEIDSVAVPAGLVATTKDLIRSFPAQG